MNPKPGEIWLADLGLAAKTRPVVAVSRQESNPPRALIIYIPLTTQFNQTNLSRLLSRVELGEEIVISNRGIPIAKLYQIRLLKTDYLFPLLPFAFCLSS